MYSLRNCADSDKSFVHQLNHSCYYDVVVRQFGAWDTVLQEQFFALKWAPEKFQVIVVEAEEVGALHVERHQDHLFLSELLISPHFQGRGIGSAVLKDIQHDAHLQKVPLRLQVLKQNGAIRLYLRIGFTECRVTDTHIIMESTTAPTP